MTLPLVDSWNIRGVKGEPYKVGPRCSNPMCERWADHAHHMVRRSQLGGDFNWVEIEGKLYPNLCGLCVAHHNDVTGTTGASSTGHKAAIRLVDGIFYWTSIEHKPSGQIIYLPYAPLDPQPLGPDAATRASTHAEDPEHCPFCGQATRRRRGTAPPVASGKRRRRKTWTIKVPDDAEDGAEVLDTLIDDAAVLMGVEPNASGRYYVIVPALYYMHQHWKDFAQSLRGTG